MSAPASPRRDVDSDQAGIRLRIQVPGRVDAITPAVERVMSAVRALPHTWGKEFEIETALREALSNAVRHGCRSDPSRSVEVTVACDEQPGVLITVSDPGPGFDPDTVPSPTGAPFVLRHSGRGLYLIRQLMDEVSFVRNGAEIRMRKR
jgi:serine/threonine-protein kinase RsbW